VSPVRPSRGAYWILGWLLTVVATYIGIQYARSRGVIAPVVPGLPTLIVGAVLCGIALVVVRRFGRRWPGVLVGGMGILCIGLGLANLVR
jgi:hypothetical protein